MGAVPWRGGTAGFGQQGRSRAGPGEPEPCSGSQAGPRWFVPSVVAATRALTGVCFGLLEGTEVIPGDVKAMQPAGFLWQPRVPERCWLSW